MFSKSVAKYIQSLQQKKFRDQHRVFVAEGIKSISEIIDEKLFVCEMLLISAEFYEGLYSTMQGKIDPFKEIIKAHELKNVSSQTNPEGVLAVFRMKEPGELVFKNKLTVILEDIRDPGNLGTIVRICDWFSVENIICSPGTVDCYNPKVVQSSMASLGRVSIIYRSISEFLHENKSIKSYAAVLGGKNISTFQKTTEAFIIIGNESKGISDDLQKLVKEKISILGKGKAESLNAAVATGIILHTLSGN